MGSNPWWPALLLALVLAQVMVAVVAYRKGFTDGRRSVLAQLEAARQAQARPGLGSTPTGE